MKITNLEKVKELLDFSDGNVYTIILVARKKNNEMITNSQEIVLRRIIRSESSFDKQVVEYMQYAKSRPENFKLYITFNPRSPLKAYKKLKERMSQWDYDIHKQQEQTIERISKIDNEWISSLQKSPANKNYYMLDLDDKSKLIQVLSLIPLHTSITSCEVEQFETKNGYHLLFEPCDTRELMQDINELKIDCELKRDDLLCIGYEE